MARIREKTLKFPGLNNTYTFADEADLFDANVDCAVGEYRIYNGDLYCCTTAHTGAWDASHFKAVKMGNEVSGLKTALSPIEGQFPTINGAIIPPNFELGVRYVSNGAEYYSINDKRMSFKRGTYLSLKQGDIVSIDKTVLYCYGGGYSTDGGSTFNPIATQTDDYTALADGIYFFWLYKISEATFTADDIENGWKYISFYRNGNAIEELETEVNGCSADINNLKAATGLAIEPETPSEFYDMPNKGAGINWQGQDTVDAGTDSSGYIELSDLYDIAIVVQNTTKYSLGGNFYYDANKTFKRRDLPGTSYDFSTYNGETVIWLNIDKTTAGFKYVRFVEDNTKGYKYWVVKNGPQATVLEDYAQMPFLGKKIVNFGDSIFGQTRPPKDVSSYLAELTGATVYNAGFGGCEMSNHADSNYNAFSMCNLADAVATGTWTTQESAASASGMPSYFAETVTMLKAIDFSEIDIATISYGTNDWQNGTYLDNETTSDKTYFADALRSSIETILTAFPNIRLFICTPTYRFWMDAQGQFVEDSNTKINTTTNTKLTDFAAKTIEVAKEYQLPYIDDYEIGMNKFDRSQYFYSTDGTHPKPEGNMLIAATMAHNLF